MSFSASDRKYQNDKGSPGHHHPRVGGHRRATEESLTMKPTFEETPGYVRGFSNGNPTWLENASS